MRDRSYAFALGGGAVQCESEEALQEAFASAEEAWFWYCRNRVRNPLAARGDIGRGAKPFQIDDVYMCLSRLYLARSIAKDHVDALIKYGDLQEVPDGRLAEQERDAALWVDAMGKLAPVMASKGIVRGNT